MSPERDKILTHRLEKLKSTVKRFKNKYNTFSTYRILTFLGIFISLITIYLLKSPEYFYLLSLALFGLFLFLVRISKQIEDALKRFEYFQKCIQREIYRREHKFDKFYEGEPDFSIKVDKFHFSKDLDIFGKKGFFTYLDNTSSIGGQYLFYTNLLRIGQDSMEFRLNRQLFLMELAEKDQLTIKLLRLFHECFSVNHEKKFNFAVFYAKRRSFFEKNELLKGIYKWLVVGCWSSIGISFVLDLPYIASTFFFVQFLLYIVNRRDSIRFIETYSDLSSKAKITLRLWSFLCNINFQELNLQKAFNPENKPRLIQIMSELSSLSSKATVVEAPLAHLILNTLFLWDFWLIESLEKWNQQHAEKLKDYTFNLEILDSLMPFAMLRWHNPDYTIPDIKGVEGFIAGKNLRHPMIISNKNISNDLNLLEKGNIVIITGSNMSGKTTYLKTIGLNVLLALCGSFVPAEFLGINDIKILSSMRVQDSLDEGISFFYAEVQNIAHILKELETTDKPCIVLMDEIFKGTNNRERTIAAKAIIKKLNQSNSFNLVTTHDLDITKETGDHLYYYHFTETIENNQMSFDYLLKKGVVNTSNALKILELEGLDLNFKEAATSLEKQAPLQETVPPTKSNAPISKKTTKILSKKKTVSKKKHGTK